MKPNESSWSIVVPIAIPTAMDNINSPLSNAASFLYDFRHFIKSHFSKPLMGDFALTATLSRVSPGIRPCTSGLKAWEYGRLISTALEGVAIINANQIINLDVTKIHGNSEFVAVRLKLIENIPIFKQTGRAFVKAKGNIQEATNM